MRTGGSLHPHLRDIPKRERMKQRVRIEFQLSGTPYIELIKLLKAVGIVRSGAAAGEAVRSEAVYRNHAVETRKRAKITAGETVTYQEWEILVVA